MVDRSQMINTLTSLLDEKYSLLLELKSLTWQQSQAITESNVDLVNELVEKKQVIIDKINVLDSKFDEIFSAFKKQSGIESIAQLRSDDAKELLPLKSAVEKVVDLINQLKTLEQENQNKAKRLLNALGDGLRRIRDGRKLNSAYNPGPLQYPSYFIDKKK